MRAIAMALALVMIGCGGEAPARTSAYGGRDYSDATCPTGFSSSVSQFSFVCDRGTIEDPRYVTIEVCAREVGVIVLPADVDGSFVSSHPRHASCLRTAGVILFTIEDVLFNARHHAA